MIWVRGEVLPDESLRISALDRTFEHGLGLFETFRTWDGHATLLGRHRDRMCRSAAALGLRLSPRDWPNDADVRRLLRATGRSKEPGMSASASPFPVGGPRPVLADRVRSTSG